jgi:lysosomal acid lipase/cholesteryl ester hydrolase
MRKNILALILLSSLFINVFNEDYKSYITKLGLNLEEETIQTEDRYINSMWRITSKDENNRNGKSVIMQHGLLDGAFTFLILAEDSLAKKLCDEGYVVYLPYIRGTQFSRDHLDYDSSLNSKYWDFSFDQIAQYDVPANIKFVKQRDNVEKVYYIGHSQGSLTFFLAYMNDPEFMENNVAKFIALGTVPNVNNAPHFLITLFEKSHILDLIPVKNFLTFPEEVGQIFVPFCTSKAKVLCNKILSLAFSGWHETGRIDYERLGKNIFLYEPGGTSVQNMKHWIQIHKAKRAQKYDFGTLENIRKYGQPTPPIYDLKKMRKYSIPSLMTTSDADPFANPQDTLDFIENIENKNIVNLLNLTNYNHIDYFWADSAITEVFPKVLSFLAE